MVIYIVNCVYSTVIDNYRPVIYHTFTTLYYLLKYLYSSTGLQ